MVFVFCSAQLLTIPLGLIVKLDNSARMNSSHCSLKRALKIKDRIKDYCDLFAVDLLHDLLDDEEWKVLENITECLKPITMLDIAALLQYCYRTRCDSQASGCLFTPDCCLYLSGWDAIHM